MRSFYIASVIIALLFSFIIPTSYYISDKTEDMHTQAKLLPKSLKDADAQQLEKELHELLDKWRTNKKLLEITIPYYELMQAETELTNTVSYFKSRNESMYSASRNRLINILEILHEAESVSWETVL